MNILIDGGQSDKLRKPCFFVLPPLEELLPFNFFGEKTVFLLFFGALLACANVCILGIIWRINAIFSILKELNILIDANRISRNGSTGTKSVQKLSFYESAGHLEHVFGFLGRILYNSFLFSDTENL